MCVVYIPSAQPVGGHRGCLPRLNNAGGVPDPDRTGRVSRVWTSGPMTVPPWQRKPTGHTRRPGDAMSQADTDPRHDLEDRLQFERLLSDLAASFVGLPADQVDGAIEDAQRRIGETLGLDRSSLFQISAEGEMVLTRIWVAPGLRPFPPRINAQDYFPWSLLAVLGGETIRFSNVTDLPTEAARDIETFRAHGPKSTVVFPLKAGDRVFGGLAFCPAS